MTHKIDSGAPSRPADTVGTKAAPRAGTERDAPVAAAPATDHLHLTGEATGLQAIQRQLGETPAGIDVARVNQIRAALADGSYRVDPQAIATRMIAFETGLTR